LRVVLELVLPLEVDVRHQDAPVAAGGIGQLSAKHGGGGGDVALVHQQAEAASGAGTQLFGVGVEVDPGPGAAEVRTEVPRAALEVAPEGQCGGQLAAVAVGARQLVDGGGAAVGAADAVPDPPLELVVVAAPGQD